MGKEDRLGREKRSERRKFGQKREVERIGISACLRGRFGGSREGKKEKRKN